MLWNNLLSWIENHSELAAWVQAIGSIAAIIAAIRISYMHENLRRKTELTDRERQAHCIAAQCGFELMQPMEDISEALKDPHPEFAEVTPLVLIERFIPSMWIMGRAADGLFRFIETIHKHNQIVKTNRESFERHELSMTDRQEMNKAAKQRLLLAQAVGAWTMDEIAKIRATEEDDDDDNNN